jgi:hypothetical protein
MKKTGFSPTTSPTTEPSQPSPNQQWEAEAAVLEAKMSGLTVQLAVVTNQMERLTSENAELRTEAREARKDSREAWAAYRELAQRLLASHGTQQMTSENSPKPQPFILSPQYRVTDRDPLVLTQQHRTIADEYPSIPSPLLLRARQVNTEETNEIKESKPAKHRTIFTKLDAFLDWLVQPAN